MKIARRALMIVPWLVGGAALCFLLAGTEVVPVLVLYIAIGVACLPGAFLLARRRRAERRPALGLAGSADGDSRPPPPDRPGALVP